MDRHDMGRTRGSTRAGTTLWPIVALDLAILATLALMSTGGDALDLFHIAFLVLVVEAFLVSSWAFWPRLLIVLAATEALQLWAGGAVWQDLTEPFVLATYALLVFVMHATRERARTKLREQATRDPLTGLLNRRALQVHLDEAVKRLNSDRTPFAVIYIDLDRFKAVNDLYGHDVGDSVLIEAARRIEGVILDGGKAGRIGGDEFAVLLSSANSAAHAEHVAQRLLAQLEAPFTTGDSSTSISASMGIAMAAPASRRSPRELLGDADRAMYSVKNAQRGAYAFAVPYD